MTEKTLKFNAGEITTNFNKTITVHVDLERNKTWLEIPGQPIDNIQVKKMVRLTPPPLLQIVSVILSLLTTTKAIQL